MAKESLWQLDEILDATQGKLLFPYNAQMPPITDVCFRVEIARKGDLLFARSRDWERDWMQKRDWFPQVIKAGISAMICATPPPINPETIPCIGVDGPFEALKNLATAARNRFQGKVICITGSVGKTSTKQGLKHVLSKQGPTTSTYADANDGIGLYLSLCHTPKTDRYSVYEVSVDVWGKRTFSRSLMAQPHVVIITDIQPDHLHIFPTLASLAEQKAQLFQGMSHDGIAILNRDNDLYEQLRQSAINYHVPHILTIGEHKLADIQLLDYTLQSNKSIVHARIFDRTISYEIGVGGKHNIKNSLAILAGAVAVGADYQQAAADLATLPTPPNRTKHIRVPLHGGTFDLINDSHNSNPASVKAALDYMQLFNVQPGGRKLLVLGEMRELGQQSESLHARLAPKILSLGIDKVYLIGPEAQYLANTLPADRVACFTEDSEILKAKLLQDIQPNDLVLFKVSRQQGNQRTIANLLNDIKMVGGENVQQ